MSVPENMQLMLASFPNSGELLDVTDQNQWYEGESGEGRYLIFVCTFIKKGRWERLMKGGEGIDMHCTRWLGEKYDGVRCFWNPQEQKMYVDLFSTFSVVLFYGS